MAEELPEAEQIKSYIASVNSDHFMPGEGERNFPLSRKRRRWVEAVIADPDENLDYGRMSFRRVILSVLSDFAADAERQRSADFPPYEMPLSWEDAYAPLNGAHANPDALAQFSAAELGALAVFDQLVASLPPEPAAMWNRANLKNDSWPAIRREASRISRLLA